jgi:biopolymer transport protein ExbD
MIHRRRLKKSTGLMLTPMIDMFTIIIVYLIVNFAPEAARVKKSDHIQLPKSPLSLNKVPPIQLEVSSERILINGQELSGLRPQDASIDAWIALGEKLKNMKTKNHPILVISDRATSYKLIDRTVGQVASAGYSEIYFLTEESKAGEQ